jgi:hypothetical protein
VPFAHRRDAQFFIEPVAMRGLNDGHSTLCPYIGPRLRPADRAWRGAYRD